MAKDEQERMLEPAHSKVRLSNKILPEDIDSLKEMLIKQAALIGKLKREANEYKAMEVSFGADDYWNIIVAKANDVIKIMKFAPKLFDLIVKVVDILQLIKGGSMLKNKSWFWWFTTIVGLLAAIAQGWKAIETNASWDAYVWAALTAIFAFLSDKIKKAVASVFVLYVLPFWSKFAA